MLPCETRRGKQERAEGESVSLEGNDTFDSNVALAFRSNREAVVSLALFLLLRDLSLVYFASVIIFCLFWCDTLLPGSPDVRELIKLKCIRSQ